MSKNLREMAEFIIATTCRRFASTFRGLRLCDLDLQQLDLGLRQPGLGLHQLNQGLRQLDIGCVNLI